MGCAWRWRPVTCSANVGRTASRRAPICVVTITPLGAADQVVVVDHARVERVALAGFQAHAVPAADLVDQEDQLSLREGPAQRRLWARIRQCQYACRSLPSRRSGCSWAQRLALRRLDHAGQLVGQRRLDRHVPHPLVVVPVQLADGRDLDLEARALEALAPIPRLSAT